MRRIAIALFALAIFSSASQSATTLSSCGSGASVDPASSIVSGQVTVGTLATSCDVSLGAGSGGALPTFCVISPVDVLAQGSASRVTPLGQGNFRIVGAVTLSGTFIYVCQ